MPFLLAKKIGMTQIFIENGTVVPVTLLDAGENTVVAVKTKDKDGYEAVQLGTGSKKKLTKAEKGQRKNLGNFRWLREFQTATAAKSGDKITADIFKVGDTVKVIGTSKGRGFQGVVKRHGFHGGPASHGQKDRLRAPGSIGATHPNRVIKGMRMAGRMGGERVTVKNLKIAAVDVEAGILAIRGAVPGKRGELVQVETIS